MKKVILFLSAAAGLVILACNKETTLAPVTTPQIFSANTKMSHTSKDTLSAAGDTIWLKATGHISDSTKKYTIGANVRTADSVNRTINSLWLRTVPVTFGTDSIGITWTALMAFPFPAVPAKNKLTTTAVFTYGLPVSSQIGNITSTDSKITYVK
jgi:hypothetical protein